ncbi:MAG: hypothetical protein R2695_04290 [Acidimicrobiales bacterium]
MSRSWSRAIAAGRLPVGEIRAMAFDADARGYHLMLGLRRHRDWTAIRPRTFAAALDGLRRSYRVVVADIDPDVEGEAATGSLDVEDRNTMARVTVESADVIVVVGTCTTKGVHSLGRTIRDLVTHLPHSGTRIRTLCNHAPRRPRKRAETTRALATLLGPELAAAVGNPLFLPHRSDIDTAMRDGAALPATFTAPIARHVASGRTPPREHAAAPSPAPFPEPIAPGSLGHWSEEAG